MATQYAVEFRVWVTVRLEAESEGEALQKVAALAGEEIGIDADLGEGLDLSPVGTVAPITYDNPGADLEAGLINIWEE